MLLVLVALYVAIGRQWVHMADHYRDSLSRLLSERLGQPVTIGRISGSWQGLDPILAFHHLEVHDKSNPQNVVASLSLARARLDSLSTLLRQRLVFSQLYARGARMTIVQGRDGRIGLQGIWPPDATAAPGPQGTDLSALLEQWVDRLGKVLSDPVIRISGVDLNLAMAGRPSQEFQIPLLDLAYRGGTFHAGGRLLDIESNRELASFALAGEHFFRGQFTGRLYLNLTSPELLDPFLERYHWRNLSILRSNVDAQAWLHFQDGLMRKAVARIDVPYLQLATKKQTLPPLERLKMGLQWDQSSPGHWRLTLHQLSWTGFGQAAGPVSGILRRDQSGWHLAIDQLTAAPWERLLQGLGVLPEDYSSALANYDPQGSLGPIAVQIPAGNAQNWRLKAQVRNASVRAWDGAPAIDNLSGFLDMGAADGKLVTQSDNFSLGFPELFAGSWTFRQFRGALNWRRQGNSGRVWADHLEGELSRGVQKGDAAHLSGSFNLALTPEKRDRLSLHVGLRHGDASLLPELVPQKIVAPGLYQWLTTAITRATVSSGDFEGHGLVGSDAPPGAFSTSMRYVFSAANVRYSPDWPLVEDAAGVVEVTNDRAHIQVNKGRTGGLDLEPGTVDVLPDGSHTAVKVQASATVPPNVIKPWFSQTPLHQFGGDWINDLNVDGGFHLGLKLGLHLGSDKSPDIHLQVDTKAGRLTYLPANLTWKGINGSVTYDSSKGMSSHQLTAHFLDRPVKLQVNQKDVSQPVNVVQEGTVALADLTRTLDVKAVPGVKGQTPYRATLSVSQGSLPRVRISAPLTGISSDWPSPLDKKSGAESPLTLSLDWPKAQVLVVRGHVDHRLAWAARWENGAFERGAIGLGRDRIAMPDAAGLSVDGRIEKLDVSQWQDRFKALTGAGATQSGVATGDLSGQLTGVSLQIGQLLLGGQSYQKVGLRIKPDHEGWLLHVSGPMLAGQIRIPKDSNKPIKAQLKKASLATKTAPDLGTVKAGGAAGSPGQWPALDASIDNLTVNGRQYGRWQFKVQPSDDGVRVSDIQGKTGDLTLKGDLEWQFERGHSDHTRFDGSLSGGNISDLSHWIGQKVPLRNKDTQVEFSLHWNGTPEQFSVRSLDGEMKFLLKSGTILQSNDAAQIFRIFGILNTDTIWRRLKLDFSDLYKAGITFDAISGKASFGNGKLTLDPELQIVGPSTAFRMSGSTNLIDESLDMRLVVILPLTQNLPLAAILLGASPPIGGALFVLDKLLGEPLSKLTSATYSISGTWNNPDVKLRNVFDTGSGNKKKPSQPKVEAH